MMYEFPIFGPLSIPDPQMGLRFSLHTFVRPSIRSSMIMLQNDNGFVDICTVCYKIIYKCFLYLYSKHKNTAAKKLEWITVTLLKEWCYKIYLWWDTSCWIPGTLVRCQTKYFSYRMKISKKSISAISMAWKLLIWQNTCQWMMLSPFLIQNSDTPVTIILLWKNSIKVWI